MLFPVRHHKKTGLSYSGIGIALTVLITLSQRAALAENDETVSLRTESRRLTNEVKNIVNLSSAPADSEENAVVGKVTFPLFLS